MRDDKVLFEFISKKIDNSKSKKLLELGAGSGLFESYVNTNYYGVDLYPKNNEILKVDIRQQQFPFKDDFFDYVVILETLEHLTDFTNCFNEIKRVMKKNGLLIGSVPKVYTINKLIKHLLRKRTDSLEHMVCFTKTTIQNMFKVNGLTIKTVAYLNKSYMIFTAKQE